MKHQGKPPHLQPPSLQLHSQSLLYCFCPKPQTQSFIISNLKKKVKKKRGISEKSIYLNLTKPFLSTNMTDVRRSKDAALGRCRKHPWHQQSPGVCSLCLGERLSRLSSSAGKKPLSRRAPVSSSSPSSVSTYYSSSSDSSYSPSPSRRRHGRLVDEAKSGPLLLPAFFGGGKYGNLKKSKSIAAAVESKISGGVVGRDEKGKKKSEGFWSKLVNRRKKRREEGNNNGLKRSGTVREKVTT